MKKIALLIAFLAASANVEAMACCRCHKAHAQARRAAHRGHAITYAPAPAAAPVVTDAAPIATTQAPPATSSGAAQPAYNYPAANGEVPAYYYSYDNSGKLIVVQWVDWLFRGGRAEGMPRPPLPIIGNFLR